MNMEDCFCGDRPRKVQFPYGTSIQCESCGVELRHRFHDMAILLWNKVSKHEEEKPPSISQQLVDAFALLCMRGNVTINIGLQNDETNKAGNDPTGDRTSRQRV